MRRYAPATSADTAMTVRAERVKMANGRSSITPIHKPFRMDVLSARRAGHAWASGAGRGGWTLRGGQGSRWASGEGPVDALSRRVRDGPRVVPVRGAGASNTAVPDSGSLMSGMQTSCDAL